jgi:hypothetical protein
LCQSAQPFELLGIGREDLICLSRLSGFSRLPILSDGTSCRLPMRERGLNTRPGMPSVPSTIKEQIQKTSAKPKSVAMDRALKEKEPSKERSGTLLSRSPRMTQASMAASIVAEKP